jgi:hypothetical protein
MMSNQDIVTISRNPNNDEAVAVKIHGGAAGASGRISSKEAAVVAINAVQDFFLDLYDIPEPGLHIRKDVDNSEIRERIGYVSAEYKGNRATAPKIGWRPLNMYMGALDGGTYKNADHKLNAHIRHAVIHAMAQGIGMTIYLGPQTRKRWAKAVQTVLDKDYEGREIAVRSKIQGDQTWNTAKHIKNPATEGLMIAGINVEQIDMFTLSEGALIALEDAQGNTLRPKYWKPGQENTVKWFMAHAKKGGKVAVV